MEKDSAYPPQRFGSEEEPEQKSPAVGEGRAHWMHTNLSKWEEALSGRNNYSSRSNRNVPPPPPQPRFPTMRRTPLMGGGGGGMGRPEPIQVVLSEAWSWSKFVRKLGGKLLYGILLMTGLSVILDQQGIIKSGKEGFGVLLFSDGIIFFY